MIEINGKKYVEEQEFEEGVKEMMHQVATILAKDEKVGFIQAMLLGGTIAESYANLKKHLFKTSQEVKEHEG